MFLSQQILVCSFSRAFSTLCLMCSTDDEESVFSVERRRRKMTSCHFIHFNLPPGEIRPTGGCHRALISCQLHSLPTNPPLPFSLSLLAVWRGIFLCKHKYGHNLQKWLCVFVRREEKGFQVASGAAVYRVTCLKWEGFADLNEYAPLDRRVKRIFGECCTRSDFVIPT